MQKPSLLPVALLLLTACSTPAPSTGAPSPGASASPGAASPAPGGGGATPAPATNTMKGASIEVTRDGKALKVEPKLSDNDYGYQRDFVFGKYVITELATMGDDEVGVVWSDGNLYNNSSAIKVRLNLSKDRIFEVAGGPDTPNTANHPGVATKEVSADKNTIVLYTYKGKMLDTGNGRKPTTEEFAVTIRNLDVRRK